MGVKKKEDRMTHPVQQKGLAGCCVWEVEHLSGPDCSSSS
jgi:hypothetical protein